MTGFVSFHGGLKIPEGQDYPETDLYSYYMDLLIQCQVWMMLRT